MIDTIELTDKQLVIIEAAGKIMTTGGITGLTTKNLGKHLQSSESAIYRHFTSKEDIVVAMLHYLCESLDQKYTLGLSIEDNAEQQFKQLFQLQFDYFASNPHFVVAVFSDGLLEQSEKINNAILRIMSVKQKFLLPIVKDGQSNGLFTSEVSSDALLHITMGTIRLQMFKWRVANFEFDIRQKGTEIVHSLLHILKK